jgi:hypothetical protein
MADKRMFSKKMISSDAFLDMPLTAQGLYFHLCMRADDDGIVDSPNKIMREVGAKMKDFTLLKQKRYILVFDSGIVLIKHWFIHNTIKKDRYSASTYIEELSSVVLKENKAYTERTQNGTGMEPVYMQNDSKTERSIEENSIEKEREGGASAFDAENAWIETYKIYPKKSGEATAKVEWMKKVGHSLDVKEVSKLIFYATKLYLSDYQEKNPDDATYRFIPRYDKWLQEDCDYWIRQYEEKQRSDEIDGS